jgi:four helix bundle protein
MSADHSNEPVPASARRALGPRALDRVTAHTLALEAGDRAWDDAVIMKTESLLLDVARQLVRAVGSIAATVAEGYARRSPRDRIRYYEYALGSTDEAESWYLAGRHTLPAETLADRTARLTSIRRLLLVMIRNERSGKNWNSPKRDHR